MGKEKDLLYDILNSTRVFVQNNDEKGKLDMSKNEFLRFSIILKELLSKEDEFVFDETKNEIAVYSNLDKFVATFYQKYAIVEIHIGTIIDKFFVTYDEHCKIVNYYKKFINRNRTHLIMIGGSFNPITNAHYQMAKEMVKNMEDSYVVIVPTCDYYIKSFKKYPNESLLKENYRYQLLTEATLFDKHILVDDIELLEKREKTKTFRTVFQVKERYKPQRISFSIGSDDLKYMSKWWCVSGLLDISDCIVVARNVLDIENEIKKYPFFADKFKKFSYLAYENKYATLSSTYVRQLMLQGEIEEIQKLIPVRAYHSLMGLVDNVCANRIKCDKDELLKLYANALE